MYREAGDVHSQSLSADDNDKYTKFRKNRKPTGSVSIYLFVLGIVSFIFLIRMQLSQTNFRPRQDQMASTTGLSENPPYNKFRKPLRHQPAEDVCIKDMSFHAVLLDNEIKRSQHLYANEVYTYHSKKNERKENQSDTDDDITYQELTVEGTAYDHDHHHHQQESHGEQIHDHSHIEDVHHHTNSESDHSIIDHAANHVHDVEGTHHHQHQQESHGEQIHDHSNIKDVHHHTNSGSYHSVIDGKETHF